MKNFKTPLLILAILLLLPTAASAAPVGKITYLEGNVDITAGDKVRTASLGEPVNAGEVLRSKAKAKAEVTFLDGNILRLAEGTRVRITDYQMGEGKATTLELFRGKTQNIVTSLAKGARYEVHTPTAVCGVRGTNFFSFIHNGASYFVPKEHSIYGYNKNMPQDVKTVAPGFAVVVPGADQPAFIQPATTIDIDKHTSDTAPGGQTEDKDKKKDGATGDGTSLNVPLEPPQEINLAETNLGQTMTKDDWTFKVRGPGDVKLIANVYFPYEYVTPGASAGQESGPLDVEPPVELTASGTLLGVVDSKTFVGTVDMTLQYAQLPSVDPAPAYLTPSLELGNVEGQMQDGSGFAGLITSIPDVSSGEAGNFWKGAASGIYVGSSGVGMYLGYLDGTYNATTGRLVAGGGLTRTPTLAPSPTVTTSDTRTAIIPYTFEQFGLDAPGIVSVAVGETGYASYVTSGIVSAQNFNFWTDIGAPYYGASQNFLTSGLLSAWAVTRINDDDDFSIATTPEAPKAWVAKYGYSGYNTILQETFEIAVPVPYFIVGNVTGYETGAGTAADPTRLRLSGRNLLYITPGYNNFDPTQWTPDDKYAFGLPASMGYFNFELWAGGGYGGAYNDYGGGAGTLELAPLYFGGYWGYDKSSPTCMYANYGGESVHVADEWGLIGSWTAPWTAPADIKIAGAYKMDYLYDSYDSYGDPIGDPIGQRNDHSYYSYLISSPVSSSSFFYDDVANNPFHGSGTGPKFYGFTAGRIGLYAQAADGYWERGAKGALAALYVNEGVAGLLTTFAPGSAVGGLTGGFYPDETGYGGYWRLDGTLTATPMPSATLSNFSLRKMGFDVTAGYQSATNPETYVGGYGYDTAFYLSAFDSALDGYRALPWGIYTLYIGGDEYDDIPSAYYSGKAADLSGKDIQISGVRYWGSKQGYWLGAIKNTLWTPIIAASPTAPESGEISGVVSGEFMSLSQYGTFGGPFYGLYDEDAIGAGYGGWIGEGVGTYTGQPLAFSSEIDGSTYRASGYGGAFNLVQDDSFRGIMGGFSEDLWLNKTSPIKFIGALDADEWMESFPTAPFLAASEINSYIPNTSAFGGSYRGFLGVAVDSANALSGGITALYQDEGGYGGILYSSDIAGAYYPESGGWKAQGNLMVYEMPVSSTIDPTRYLTKSYTATEVPVDVISGGTVRLRESMLAIQNFSGQPWGIWSSISGATVDLPGTGALAPRNWISIEDKDNIWIGGYGGQYLNFNLAAPVNGVSTGTVAGAQAIWGMTEGSESYTVVVGGAVKGIFDPNTTPLTWTAISQGGYMKTDAFLAMQSGMSDIERANFERAMKIPTFDVGMGNLSGSFSSETGNMSVSMNNIKFFRFQNETNPAIWATDAVSGTYSSSTKNYTGTMITMTGSGGLSNSLTQTFEVKQWDTTNNNWGASTYKGATDTAGTLTRSTVDRARLPSAPTSITITAMPGAAAGTINTTAQTFSGTGAGTVKTTP